MKRIPRSKYQIWDNGKLVPAFVHKPRDSRAILLGATNAQERKLGIKYYIPAASL